jgi:hypothetical protein
MAAKDITFAGQKYVLVDDKDVKDVKSPAFTAPSMSVVPRGVKLKSITVTLPYSQALGCDASGLSNTLATVDPSTNTAEWSAFAALYGEYRILKGAFKFGLWCRQSTPAFLSTNLFAIGFDPTDIATLPGGTRQITEMSQHLLLAPELVTAGATASADVYGFKGGLHTLNWVCPRADSVVGSGTSVTSLWTSTKAFIPPGSIKMYVQTSNVSTNVLVGINYVVMQFRSRIGV